MCMRTLPNIEITEEQLYYMYGQDDFSYGSESTIYEIPSIFGSGTLAKIFDSSKTVIENKFEKIKRLYQLEELEKINDIKILSSISCKGEIIGYLMNKSAYTEMGIDPVPRIEQLKQLAMARQKLEQFLQLGIIYGDVNASNILVGKNDVCLCDLDNVAYQGFGMDLLSDSADIFIWNYRKIDEKLISYMHNLLTINELNSFVNDWQTEGYINSSEIPQEFMPDSFSEIRKQMRMITPQYQGLYFVDFIKEEYKKATL